MLTGSPTGAPPPGPIGPGLEPAYGLYSSAMPSADEHEGRIVRVGASRAYTSVNAGIAAALSIRPIDGRSLVVIDTGTYVEQVYTEIGVDLAGATGDPSDVVIEHTCPTGNSPLNTSSGPIWIGGITLRLLDYPSRTGSGVYSIHHRGEALTIFEDLLLDNEGNLGSIGMDGVEGSDNWLIGCEFANHLAASDRVTNMHGAIENTAPLRMVYDNCNTNGLGVNYNDGGSGQPDTLYVVGGSVNEVDAVGTSLVAVIDPSVPVVSTGPGVSLTRSTSLPTRPFHGAT